MEHLLANNVPLEKVLSDFAERSQVSDICHFADVFAIGKRSGGNLKELIGDSCEIIAMRNAIPSVKSVHYFMERLWNRK